MSCGVVSTKGLRPGSVASHPPYSEAEKKQRLLEQEQPSLPSPAQWARGQDQGGCLSWGACLLCSLPVPDLGYALTWVITGHPCSVMLWSPPCVPVCGCAWPLPASWPPCVAALSLGPTFYCGSSLEALPLPQAEGQQSQRGAASPRHPLQPGPFPELLLGTSTGLFHQHLLRAGSWAVTGTTYVPGPCTQTLPFLGTLPLRSPGFAPSQPQAPLLLPLSPRTGASLCSTSPAVTLINILLCHTETSN